MKERPILFNTEMVKAILGSRKTETRRPIRPQPPSSEHILTTLLETTSSARRKNEGKHQWAIKGSVEENGLPYFSCPFGQVGDRLWVREMMRASALNMYYCATPGKTFLLENFSDEQEEWFDNYNNKKRGDEITIPSIHMPRWASRILLEITDIRVEKIHNIRAQDVMAEGTPLKGLQSIQRQEHLEAFAAAIWIFKKRWDAIYKKPEYTWDTNPWVWVVEFKRI